MTDPFAAAFVAVIGEEGGYSADPADPGNWTGGAVGRGALRGTMYGISAAAYPTLDIANLTLGDAQGIYRTRYWVPACCDNLAPALALLMFDAAVNLGVAGAARVLQQAAGCAADGLIGPVTLAAVDHLVALAAGVAGACAEFQARRMLYMIGLPDWHTFALGWARRLCSLPFKAAALLAPAQATTPPA